AYQRTNRLKTIWEMTFFGGVEIGPLSAGGESARTIFAVSSNEKNWFEHVAEFQRENVVPSNVGVWSPELPL
ncbi:hypothetical protein, partial [Stutzerimonas stutzeri]